MSEPQQDLKAGSRSEPWPNLLTYCREDHELFCHRTSTVPDTRILDKVHWDHKGQIQGPYYNHCIDSCSSLVWPYTVHNSSSGSNDGWGLSCKSQGTASLEKRLTHCAFHHQASAEPKGTPAGDGSKSGTSVNTLARTSCFYEFGQGVLLVGVLRRRALQVGVCTRAPDFLKLTARLVDQP